MKSYILLPLASMVLVALAFKDEFLSGMYILKMGTALLLLVLAALFLIKDVRHKNYNKRNDNKGNL